jgi:hypothetical protein
LTIHFWLKESQEGDSIWHQEDLIMLNSDHQK